MKISILTFHGFNEIDSLVAFRMLKWLRKPDWNISICCPEAEVTSMGGLTIRAHSMLEDAAKADAVMVGSGNLTRDIIADEKLMSRIELDPQRQVIAAQRALRNISPYLSGKSENSRLSTYAVSESQFGNTKTPGCTLSARAKIFALSTPRLILPDSIPEIVD